MQEPTKLIYKKLLDIMKGVGAVAKDRKNQQQGYNFRGIDDVMNELHEKFSEHGVFILTDIVDQKREERATKSGGLSIYSINTYRFTFMAEDGSSIQSTQIGEGMDSGDKASNKAASVALKYALLFMFLIPTEDAKDPEHDDHSLRQRPAAQTSAPKPAPQNKNKPDGPVRLSPSDSANPERWNKVISWLKDNGKVEADWPAIKSKMYIISDADEAVLFEAMGWLPF